MAKKRKKQQKKKSSSTRPLPQKQKSSSTSLFFCLSIIVAVLAVLTFVLISHYNITSFDDATGLLQGRTIHDSTSSRPPQNTTEETSATPALSTLTKRERLELRGGRHKTQNCFPNGRCVNLRPWKSKRKYKKKENCEDRRDGCPQWAKAGQCDRNPGWMIVYCSVSCKACHLLDTKKRCRRSDKQVPVLQPGDIKDIFLGLEEKYPQYETELLRDGENELYFAVFKNFLTDFEADTLIKWLENMNPKRSTTQSDAWNDEGVMTQSHNSVRTSENAWCTQGCWADEIVMNIVDRISNITTVPPRNFENFQMVRYTKGQFYREHNDCNPKDNTVTQTAGHRIFTFFLYLNTPEEGGATDFPKLGHRVKAQKGWAAFWPDVKNLDPEKCDLRYSHHAMDVTKGIKYGANIWVHQWDYQTSSLWGCTGSFEG